MACRPWGSRDWALSTSSCTQHHSGCMSWCQDSRAVEARVADWATAETATAMDRVARVLELAATAPAPPSPRKRPWCRCQRFDNCSIHCWCHTRRLPGTSRRVPPDPVAHGHYFVWDIASRARGAQHARRHRARLVIGRLPNAAYLATRGPLIATMTRVSSAQWPLMLSTREMHSCWTGGTENHLGIYPSTTP